MWWRSMDEREKIVNHGIIDVMETVIEVGGADWAKRLDQSSSRDRWKSHLPDIEWLRAEYALAVKANERRPFRAFVDWGWYVESMIANLELLNRFVDSDAIVDAVISAAEVARLATESNIKFHWEKYALSGKKAADGAASTRIATDEERREVVNAILVSEAPITKAQAFIRAEEIRPDLGTEASYRRSYYLKDRI